MPTKHTHWEAHSRAYWQHQHPASNGSFIPETDKTASAILPTTAQPTCDRNRLPAWHWVHQHMQAAMVTLSHNLNAWRAP